MQVPLNAGPMKRPGQPYSKLSQAGRKRVVQGLELSQQANQPAKPQQESPDEPLEK